MKGRPELLATAAGLAALALGSFPACALAHATLEATQPSRGEQVARVPERVILRFAESVEVAFGAVRVFDASGKRVDTGPTQHPSGRGDEVSVRLRDGLPDGVYTATYRVISADSHPVSGGFVFMVGEGGAAPSWALRNCSRASRPGR